MEMMDLEVNKFESKVRLLSVEFFERASEMNSASKSFKLQFETLKIFKFVLTSSKALKSLFH